MHYKPNFKLTCKETFSVDVLLLLLLLLPRSLLAWNAILLETAYILIMAVYRSIFSKIDVDNVPGCSFIYLLLACMYSYYVM